MEIKELIKIPPQKEKLLSTNSHFLYHYDISYFSDPVCGESEPNWMDAAFQRGFTTEQIVLEVDGIELAAEAIFKNESHGAYAGLVLNDNIPFLISSNGDTYKIERPSFIPIALFNNLNIQIPKAPPHPTFQKKFDQLMCKLLNVKDIDFAKEAYFLYQTGNHSFLSEHGFELNTHSLELYARQRFLISNLSEIQPDINTIDTSVDLLLTNSKDGLIIQDKYNLKTLYLFAAELNMLFEYPRLKERIPAEQYIKLLTLKEIYQSSILDNIQQTLEYTEDPGKLLLGINTINENWSELIKISQLGQQLEPLFERSKEVHFIYLIKAIQENIALENHAQLSNLISTFTDNMGKFNEIDFDAYGEFIVDILEAYENESQFSDPLSEVLQTILKKRLSDADKCEEFIGEIIFKYMYKGNNFIGKYFKKCLDEIGINQTKFKVPQNVEEDFREIARRSIENAKIMNVGFYYNINGRTIFIDKNSTLESIESEYYAGTGINRTDDEDGIPVFQF